MIGYKAFDQNLKCRGFQFEVGKTYIKDTPKEEMQCCTSNVFHFCRELYAIERESEYKLSESRICEVIAGDVVRNGDKYGTNHLTILREIVGEEKNGIINSGNRNSGDRNSGNRNSGDRNSGNFNSGDYNSGDCNSGDCNSGNRNSGDCNSGDCNSGNRNSGDRNSGDFNSGDYNSGNRNSGYCNSGYRNSGNRNSGNRNSGYCNSGYCNSGDYNSGNRNSGDRNSGNRNSGNRNSGDRNSGDYNSGDYNSGDYNSGYCNSTTPPVRIFNRETGVAREYIRFPDFFFFDLAIFVSYDTATDEEREQHKKDIETCGGFLKTIHYKEAWRKSWDKASDADRRKVLDLPNWDNEVFKEISGIDVEMELGIRKEACNE